MKQEEPKVRVGIMTAPSIDVTYFGGNEPEFELHDVTIGINFHWERKENQRFRGDLEILHNPDGTVTAVNVIPMEQYLKSVISSEMSATSSMELLKAHAVISRSWLLAQIDRKRRFNGKPDPKALERSETEDTIVRWYDRDDHDRFDVCADDHCQRYQGITRMTSKAVEEAVEATRGEVLTVDNSICDARFSKCCGGVMEEFQNCWEPMDHSYLKPLRDNPEPKKNVPDLTVEENAVKWIKTDEPAFCNTNDRKLLEQVLNHYDREDITFYRWKEKYTPAELNELVCRRSGIDFGEITAITPVKRGPSGRLYLLKITGTKRTVLVGKELEIRKWFSNSHLKSSAFIVERDADGNWIFEGSGWGHGVGLCQIGAAVMASKGYTYRQILNHYFVDADINKLY